LGIRPVRPIAGGRSIDQSRLALLQSRIAQPEFFHDPGTEILCDHVRAVDEVQRNLLAPGRLEIERDAAFVAVGAQMQHALAVVPDVAARPVPLPRTLGRFDRDHVRAEISQRLDAHRAEQEMVEADDANSLQQVEHAGSWAGRPGHYARGAADRKWIAAWRDLSDAGNAVPPWQRRRARPRRSPPCE